MFVKSFCKIFALGLLIFCLTSFVSSGQNEVHKKKPSKIQWMSFTEAYQQSLKDNVKKKVFIDVYTQWCGWCKRMDASTFEDTEVIDYMNAHFYPVKLDAETRDTIHFGERIFVYRPEFKANEIALALLKQQMSYPTSVYLDEEFSMLDPVPGYQTTEQLMPLLRYFGEDIFKTVKWEDYQKQAYH